MINFRQVDRLKNNYLPIAIAKGRIIVNFCQGGGQTEESSLE
ncbi:hypothetical protein C789_611 [Microcystis aeruginosa FACHB-905 = DIANCHI905]|uniref:Uncharacterized protein n=1 Tax=Microcystis aeruginosa PCC 7806SL TaxID=1903187 RepID=A0AB33BYX0_MICA7|nr:hypothetical protein BH695_1487 [Microcystis aeruginosa PCC 7806SL]ELS49617.1 hypothetical protein C789_611 [Microcystis aeruginosa FACHB-905 = DIANCHI905]